MKLGLLLWLASFLPLHAQDQVCLATTVYLEARDQSTLGQVAVAEVALRRRERGLWGKSVCEVVLKHKQFAPAYTSKDFRIRNNKAWNRAWQVARDALAMWREPSARRQLVVPGADHFFAHNLVQPSWATGRKVSAVIGDHTFVSLGL
jgi:spore germination cell wall hydrolase CwlJ-like protein